MIFKLTLFLQDKNRMGAEPQVLKSRNISHIKNKT